ncbi:hypothetical protein [Limnoglobus roseus]|uniref:Uncharacterized protein n=1 Tax=Limnoglobus roseus TaxID=2598579 RepID=A0A5C1AJF3_9BACT|nr:hypothetical protein [Limnoglobus roseus]QEL18297.1 hypothetical protein PX52LOC_05316 [Limnoglobus roseus]
MKTPKWLKAVSDFLTGRAIEEDIRRLQDATARSIRERSNGTRLLPRGGSGTSPPTACADVPAMPLPAINGILRALGLHGGKPVTDVRLAFTCKGLPTVQVTYHVNAADMARVTEELRKYELRPVEGPNWKIVPSEGV